MQFSKRAVFVFLGLLISCLVSCAPAPAPTPQPIPVHASSGR